MPQASLLSYFSKPTIPTSTVQPAARKDSLLTTEHDTCLPVTESRGLGIIEAARKQSAQPKANPAVTTPKFEEDQPQSRRYDAKDRTSDRLQQFNVVLIPRLPEALIAPVSPQHLSAIRRLTVTTLPVRYSDAFFTTTVTDTVVSNVSRVVLYASEPVGWIRCRFEPCSTNTSLMTQSHPPPSQIYIQALALLSPYRGLGLATLLLDTILSSASAHEMDAVCIYAHVWEKNEDALEWYARRGFKRVMLIEQYYRKLRPSGAWIVRKELQGA
ncbi:hypothetical protein AYO21_09159 [Fonsecaea monophora]|uniref:N-acetyltransferase domain-containing protein n=1 Tax=Fonsecaea monophora TaxID=254056 RepID=A0A177F064_9EURO|nr:hypothetical protein AYO21_09159 [Fonsecaea monophora]KAH0846142.1 putative N-acetyltransferase san [Fonsecaea pedrosoi]OAG36599.1 hypothetical protein AYO21_09159 [Fonsecaea monophora]